MSHDDPRRPVSRLSARRDGGGRHLFAMPDDAPPYATLSARLDQLATRAVAGDQMVAELKARIDDLQGQLDFVEARAEHDRQPLRRVPARPPARARTRAWAWAERAAAAVGLAAAAGGLMRVAFLG